MFSLLFLSDLHLSLDQPIARKDDAAVTQSAKFEYILKYREKRNSVILQAGDFFHAPRSWRTLSHYADLLSRYNLPPIYCVAGQHDDYMYNEDSRSSTSLGILATTGLLTILGENPVEFDFGKKVAVYGCSFSSQRVPSVKTKSDLDILVIHATISNSAPWAGAEQYYLASDFLNRYLEFDIILCGDVHRKFLIKDRKRFICNTGPILRREASQDMFDHHPGFWEYEVPSNKLIWHEIHHKPAEEVLSREHIDSPQEIKDSLSEFIAMMQTGQYIIPTMQFKQNLAHYIKENKVPDPVRRILNEIMGEE